jgi:tetratricopeptide (TPR) repeat protein
MVEMILGDHASAQERLNVALHIVQDTGNRRGQGSALHQLARLQLQRGDINEAVALYRRCLRVNQYLGDAEGLSWTHCRLGGALRLLGQHTQALQHLHQAQFHARQIDDDLAVASCLIELGAVYRDRGDYDAAATYCAEALQAVKAMPIADLAAETHACLVLAEVDVERGEHESALNHLDRVDTVTGHTHSASDQARASELRGDILFARGDVAKSARSWRRAADLYRFAGNPAQVAVVARKLGGLPDAPGVGGAHRWDATPSLDDDDSEWSGSPGG